MCFSWNYCTHVRTAAAGRGPLPCTGTPTITVDKTVLSCSSYEHIQLAPTGHYVRMSYLICLPAAPFGQQSQSGAWSYRSRCVLHGRRPALCTLYSSRPGYPGNRYIYQPAFFWPFLIGAPHFTNQPITNVRFRTRYITGSPRQAVATSTRNVATRLRPVQGRNAEIPPVGTCAEESMPLTDPM